MGELIKHDFGPEKEGRTERPQQDTVLATLETGERLISTDQGILFEVGGFLFKVDDASGKGKIDEVPERYQLALAALKRKMRNIMTVIDKNRTFFRALGT